MIRVLTDYTEKRRTRPLYEAAFPHDGVAFVDYYYDDRCLDNRIVVEEEDGEIISMAHLNPYTLCVGNTTCNTCYIFAVATLESRRHEGHMRAVLEKAFSLMKEERIPFTYLIPMDVAIYDSLGFEVVCDFRTSRLADESVVPQIFDIYCLKDEAYLRRERKERMLSEADEGQELPDHPVIMARVTNADAFKEMAAQSGLNPFANREALPDTETKQLEWLRSGKLYFVEEV